MRNEDPGNNGTNRPAPLTAPEDLIRYLRRNAEVTGALCSAYDNIFVVDVETETYVHYQSDLTGMHKPVLNKTLRCANYHDGLLAYIDEYVADEDKDRLRRNTTTEAFLAQTPDVGVNSLTYRRIYKGRSHYYQLSSAKFTGEDGRLYLVLGFHDASPVVEAEQRKSAELATMQAIIEAAEMGTWRIELVEGERPRMLADARMLELLGLDRDAKGMTPEDVYDAWYSRVKPEALQSVLDSVARMEAGSRDENTYLWIHPTLGERYVRCGGTATPIKGGYRLCGYHYDVDELVREKARQDAMLKEALLAAEHANNAKTTFLNSMSHDIRTPMNAIMGYTELAKENIGDADLVANYLEKISVSSSHLLSLINDVLDMSRIESGKVIIKERECELARILGDLRTIMQANAEARQLTLLFDAQDLVHETLICDSLRLQQVLLNILSNAVKFTQPGGTISLSVVEKPGRDDGHARYEFRVRDSGIGIGEEFQEHIFEPFTREESTTVSGIQGTGLGLAISKNIMDMMGGDISVTSVPRRGSEFTVSLECEVGGTSAGAGATGAASGATAACGGAARAADAGATGAATGAAAMNAATDLQGSSAGAAAIAGAEANCPAAPAGANAGAEAAGEAEEAALAADVAGAKILLVEDNEMNREIGVAIFSQRGIKVQAVSDGDVAVKTLRAAAPGDFDLVLMDVQMPHLNGYDATRAIRALPNGKVASIPIIATTANAFEEDRALAKAAGMNDFIVKPIDIDEAIRVIRKLVRR